MSPKPKRPEDWRPISIPERLRNPHAVVKRAEARSKFATQMDGQKRVRPEARPGAVRIVTTRRQVPRALRIAHAVCVRAEEFGYRVVRVDAYWSSLTRENVSGVGIRIGNFTYPFDVCEIGRREIVRGPLYASGKLEVVAPWRTDQVPKQTRWQETDDETLSHALGSFFPTLLERADVDARLEAMGRRVELKRQVAREEEKAALDRTRAETRQLLAARAQGQMLFAQAMAQAERWNQSRQLREYAAHLKSLVTRSGRDPRLDAWSAWILQAAKSIDPTTDLDLLEGLDAVPPVDAFAFGNHELDDLDWEPVRRQNVES